MIVACFCVRFFWCKSPKKQIEYTNLDPFTIETELVGIKEEDVDGSEGYQSTNEERTVEN
jgi:hypothetical protein